MSVLPLVPFSSPRTEEECGIDARDLDDEDWTHSCLPFNRGKILVDGLLDYGSLQPWSYRTVLGYLFRGQLDFGDVFRPTIFRGKDKDIAERYGM